MDIAVLCCGFNCFLLVDRSKKEINEATIKRITPSPADWCEAICTRGVISRFSLYQVLNFLSLFCEEEELVVALSICNSISFFTGPQKMTRNSIMASHADRINTEYVVPVLFMGVNRNKHTHIPEWKRKQTLFFVFFDI
jgi:hypothetical protein